MPQVDPDQVKALADAAVAKFKADVDALTGPSVASPDGTYLPPATQLLDSNGDTWTLNTTLGNSDGAQVQKNGQLYRGGYADLLAISGNSIYALNRRGQYYACTLTGNWIPSNKAQMPAKTN